MGSMLVKAARMPVSSELTSIDTSPVGGRETDGLVCGDESALGESDGRRDGRMPAEGHLGDGEKYRTAISAIARRARDEGRLGIVDVDRDLLHLGIGQRRRVEHDAGRARRRAGW